MTAFFSSRAQLLSLLLLLFSALPAFSQIGILIWGCLLVVVGSHRLIKRLSTFRWGLFVVMLGLCGVQLWLNNVEWISAEAVLSALVILLILKWAESNTEREYRVVVLASTLLAAMSSLYLPSLPALAFLLVVGVAVIVLLLVIADTEQRLKLPKLFNRSLGFTLLALPITVLLFVTVPRVQGPLWDIGLVIGLPIELAIDQDSKGIGLKGTMKAGQVSRLKKSDAPVLVAEFDGAVPYKSRMYWRGPVFSDYDGVTWSLPQGWDKRSTMMRGGYRGKGAAESTLTSKRDRVYYEARVSPHEGHWLYSLDMPAGQTPEAFISKDLQLLGIRKISWEFKYDIYAWLEYTGGRKPTAQQMQSYLAYPQGSNPRLYTFGQSLLTKYALPQDRIDELYRHFAGQGYQMSLTSELEEGQTSLDSYFFDEKIGTIEHLASSTAMVLRAAGIPTRLITGYRGGSLIALTDFVVVKQEHAHVWVEAWTDEKGWQRVEAKDLVVPPEKNRNLQQSAQAKTKPQAAPKPKSVAPAATPQPQQAKKSEPKKAKPSSESGLGWLKKLSSGVETWVLNYNPDRQVELLKKSGLRKVDWKNLLALSFIGLLVLSLVYALFLQLGKAKTDPVLRAFNDLNKRFSKLDLACAEGECPSQWLLRVKAKQPELYPMLKQVVDLYTVVRYGGQDSKEQRDLFIRDVKRLVAML